MTSQNRTHRGTNVKEPCIPNSAQPTLATTLSASTADLAPPPWVLSGVQRSRRAGGDDPPLPRTASIAPLTDANASLLEFVLAAAPERRRRSCPARPPRRSATWPKSFRATPAPSPRCPDSYLGPLVRVARGQTVRVHVRNELDEPTNVHWHGLIVPVRSGWPALQPGRAGRRGGVHLRRAQPPRHRTGSIPHPHGRTAEQAYARAGRALHRHRRRGERRWGCQPARRTFPLVIQDRRFDAGNQLAYVDARHGGHDGCR
jgi:endonuclease YncB( thermonuclease family)